jgi:hypothetical protein
LIRLAGYDRSMLRLLPVVLSLQLVLVGCTTTKVMTYGDLKREIQAGKDHVVVSGQEGTSMRLDPHSELRFLLRSGEVTGWVRGQDLWRSELGLSFAEEGGVFFVGWNELAGVEVRNLSGGKTAAAVVIGIVIVGLVVLAVIAMAKGGGGPGGSGNKIGGGKSKSKASSGLAHRPVARRRLLRRGRGGVHFHIPLAIALGAHHHHPHGPADAPPPPPPPPGPPRAAPQPEPEAPPEGAVDIHAPAGASPAPGPNSSSEGRAGGADKSTRMPAVRLFDDGVRRRSWIQLWGNVAAGTELARFEGYTGSVAAGIRIRDVVELGGGFRNHLARPRGDDAEGLDPGYVGFGRLGMHLWLDDGHRFALPIGVDAGAGSPVRLHLRANIGLRVFPTRSLSIGLFPFNPSFHYYTEDSVFASAMRWRFPTTLEVGFCF